MTVFALHFSPTGSTKQIAERIAASLDLEFKSIDLSVRSLKSFDFYAKDTAVIAMPVFVGRIPAKAAEALKMCRANGTCALSVAVFGARAVEDALLETNDILKAQGFKTIASAAFVARHSVVPSVAEGRPDADDLTQIDAFAKNAADKIMRKDFTEPEVPGHRPYRDAPAAGVAPLVSSACIKCGLCAENCPAAAIPLNAPNTTDALKCFMCMRCVRLCPAKARALPEPVLKHVEELLKNTVKGRTKNEIYL